ncbi:MAG: hypothetical protein Q8Q49_04820 [bacterium]|nr:hypothetical protein [bacterium]
MAKFYSFLLFLLILILVFVGYFHRVTAFTQDLGRHILIGNIIVSTHSIPQTNLLSYTYPDFPFLNHHWLSEVVFALLAKTGTLGLLMVSTIVALLAFGSIFLYAYKKIGVSACIVSLLLLPILFERTDIRPELLSFLLFALFLIILFKNRERQTKLVYLLPLLMLIWVNVHIYFFTGLLLIVLFLTDGIITKKRNILCNYNRSLLTLLILSLLTTFLNPHGLQGVLYPLSAFKNYGYTIEENQNIFLLDSLGFHKTSVVYFKITAILLFILLLFRLRKAKPIDWLLTITFTCAGALAVRNLPLFSLAVLIPFATNLSGIVEYFMPNPKKTMSQKQILPVHLLFILLIAVSLWHITTIAKKNQFGFSEDPGASKAVDFFQANHLRGPIFNNFDIGSYLAYRLYPSEKVFVDGRPEAYPASFFQNVYIPLQENPDTFTKIERQYQFNTILFSHTDQTPWAEGFLKSILRNTTWRVIYLDQTVLILVKNTPENKGVISRFGMELTRLTARFDPNDKQSLLQLTSFFSRINDPDAMFPLLQQLLTLDPKNCTALYNRAAIALSKQDPLGASYVATYENICKKHLLQ